MNRFHDTYRLFEIQELYINDEPQNKYRAVGNIPLKAGDVNSGLEHKEFVADSRRKLTDMIAEWYGDSRRDEVHREWSHGDAKTAHNWVVDHPEIKGAVLTWTWDNRAIYEEQGFRLTSVVDTYDAEYCFAGLRGDLINFLNQYDCWDCYIGGDDDKTHIDEYGILRVSHQNEDPNLYDFHYCNEDAGFAVLGDIIDNADEDLENLVSDILQEKVKKGEITRGEFIMRMREAGFRW